MTGFMGISLTVSTLRLLSDTICRMRLARLVPFLALYLIPIELPGQDLGRSRHTVSLGRKTGQSFPFLRPGPLCS